MRYRLLVCAMIAIALLLVMSGTRTTAQTPPSPTPAPPTTPDQEALRQQFATFLNGMQGVVTTLQANPVTANALAATGTDPAGALANAQQQVPQFTSTDLTALQAALSQNPNWQQIPAEMQSALAAIPHSATAPAVRFPNSALLSVLPNRPAQQGRQPAAPSQFLAFVREFNGAPASTSAANGALADLVNPFGGRTQATTPDADCLATGCTKGNFTDRCEDLGSEPDFNAKALNNAALALNEVQSTVMAAVFAAPGVFAAFTGVDIPTGVKIGLAIAWGVANAAYLATSQTAAVALDCAQIYFFNMQFSVLPTDGATTTPNIIPTSSAASVQALHDQAQSMSSQITTVQGVVNTISNCQILGNTGGDGGLPSCPPGLLNAADTLNATLTEDNTNLSEVQNDVKDTQNQTYALNDTLCNHDTTQACLSTSVLAKARKAIVNLSTFQALQVRMEIEANLSVGGNNRVGLFELPKSQGGFLDTVAATDGVDGVRAIVRQTIDREKATGKSVTNAESYWTQAEAAYTAKQYKSAYGYYATAYQNATK